MKETAGSEAPRIGNLVFAKETVASKDGCAKIFELIFALDKYIIACTLPVQPYTSGVIRSFANDATKDVYDGVDSKAARTIPKTLWTVARRKLDMLSAAHTLLDLKAPPSNQLEALKGALKGKHSIRVNDQYRVVFTWKDGAASDVIIADYH